MAPAQDPKSWERLRLWNKLQDGFRIMTHLLWRTQGLGAPEHWFLGISLLKPTANTFCFLVFHPERGIGITLSCKSKSFILGKQNTHPWQKIPRSRMNIPSPVEDRAPNCPALICGIHQSLDNSLRSTQDVTEKTRDMRLEFQLELHQEGGCYSRKYSIRENPT